MKKIQLDDFLNYNYISNLKVSKKGKLAFILSKANKDKTSYDRNLYLYDGKVRQLTQTNKISNYLFVDDSTILYEADNKDGYILFNYLNIETGIIKEAFSLPLLSAQIKLIDEKHIAILSSIKKDNPDLYKDKDYKNKYTLIQNGNYEILDETPFWFNGAGFINGSRTALFTMELGKPNTLKRITDTNLDIGRLEINDGNIYFLADEVTNKHSLYSKIYKVNKNKVDVYASSNTIHFSSFYFLNNELYILGNDNKKYGLNQNDNIYIYKDDKLSLYYKNEESFGSSVGSDCRLGGGKSLDVYNNELYYISTRFNGSYIYKLDNKKEIKVSLNDEGSIDEICAFNNKIYFVGMLENNLQEIYCLDLVNKKQEKVTSINKEVLKGKYVADYEEIKFNCHGLDLYGWVLKPYNYNPKKKYPAILDIHGGPKTVYGKVFYHEMQYWASKGYFVFFSNPIGGDGRGNEFMYMAGKYGNEDYDCLMKFTDVVLKNYPQIDKNNVFETGGSYGGFMTNWIIGHTDRFKACASQRSISNWLSFAGTSDIGYMFAKDQQGVKDVIKDETTLWEHSPLKYAENVKTPTLFIHSDEDYRCPIEQGLQMMNALIENNVETRMCYFHHENHELSRGGKPLNRIKRLEEITNWFDKHKGKGE